MEHSEVRYEIRLSYRTRLAGSGSHTSSGLDQCALDSSRERCLKIFEAVTKRSSRRIGRHASLMLGQTAVCNNHVSGCGMEEQSRFATYTKNSCPQCSVCSSPQPDPNTSLNATFGTPGRAKHAAVNSAVFFSAA